MATNIKNQPKSPTRPDLVDVLQEQKRGTMIDLNCVQIGIIKEFDSGDQSATIQLALKRVIAVAEDGSKTLQERPLILKCPVMVLFGGASFINLPIAPGDNCIVLFNDREIDNWFVNGGMQAPTTRRTHDISDAIAIVGIRNLQTSIGNYLANGIRICHNGGSSQMDFTDMMIESVANLFLHHGNVEITENLYVHQNLRIGGNTYGDSSSGDGGNINLYANILQQPGFELHDGRGISGDFERVRVRDGIVIGTF